MSVDPEIQLVMNPVVQMYDSAVKVGELLAVCGDTSYHHFPVSRGGKLVGLCLREQLQQVSSGSCLGDICTAHFLSVLPSEKLCSVLDLLRESHCSVALILNEDELLGIFTLSDVCRLFADYLRFGTHPGEEEYVLS